MRGIDLFGENKLEEAASSLKQAIEADPQFTDAYEALGVVYSRLGRLDESILLMRKLIELDPESIMARTNLSVLYMKKGMKNEAEKEQAEAALLSMKKGKAGHGTKPLR